MARVYIDTHMFSEQWFKNVLQDLLGSKNVTFSYGESTKMATEVSKVRQALEFYKRVGALKTPDNRSRREDADKASLETHQALLENMDCYCDCSHCDDSHILALIYVKPTPYVFSMDQRMAKCRDTLNKSIDRRYCNFIVISADSIYKSHKGKIFC